MLIIVISATLSYFIPVLTIPFLIPTRPYSSLLSWHMRVCVCVCALLCLQEHGRGFIDIRTGTLSTSLEKMSLPFPLPQGPLSSSGQGVDDSHGKILCSCHMLGAGECKGKITPRRQHSTALFPTHCQSPVLPALSGGGP